MIEIRNMKWLLTLTLAVAMAAPGAMAQIGGGTIIGASSKDDAGPQKNATEIAREAAAAKAKVAVPVVPTPVTREDKFKLELLAAQTATKAGKYDEALARLAELDAMAEKTADESFLIERNRVAVASLSGDEAMLLKSLELVLETGKLSKTENIEFSEALTRKYFNRKEFAKSTAWATRYFSYGGNDAAIRRALVLSFYFNNEFARAAEEVALDIQTAEIAGAKPSEEDLRLLVSCAQKQNDKVAYASALQKYAAYYPKTK